MMVIEYAQMTTGPMSGSGATCISGAVWPSLHRQVACGRR